MICFRIDGRRCKDSRPKIWTAIFLCGERYRGRLYAEPNLKQLLETKTLVKTDASGHFEAFVPRDTNSGVYVLHFVADDKEVGIASVDAASYRPTDADIQKGVVVRFISSKKINAN